MYIHTWSLLVFVPLSFGIGSDSRSRSSRGAHYSEIVRFVDALIRPPHLISVRSDVCACVFIGVTAACSIFGHNDGIVVCGRGRRPRAVDWYDGLMASSGRPLSQCTQSFLMFTCWNIVGSIAVNAGGPFCHGIEAAVAVGSDVTSCHVTFPTNKSLRMSRKSTKFCRYLHISRQDMLRYSVAAYTC